MYTKRSLCKEPTPTPWSVQGAYTNSLVCARSLHQLLGLCKEPTPTPWSVQRAYTNSLVCARSLCSLVSVCVCDCLGLTFSVNLVELPSTYNRLRVKVASQAVSRPFVFCSDLLQTDCTVHIMMRSLLTHKQSPEFPLGAYAACPALGSHSIKQDDDAALFPDPDQLQSQMVSSFLRKQAKPLCYIPGPCSWDARETELRVRSSCSCTYTVSSRP